MSVLFKHYFSLLAVLEKIPLGEMGLRYWGYILVAVLLIFGGAWLARSLWKQKKKGLAVVALLAELATAAALIFFAEGLRQPQEITDPGVPDIELPELDELAEPAALERP